MTDIQSIFVYWTTYGLQYNRTVIVQKKGSARNIRMKALPIKIDGEYLEN